MTIGDDFEITVSKNIRYTGAAHGAEGAGYYSVIEFHRWLQDLADDASSISDDYMDITRDTPSDRSTDNIVTLINSYNIDDEASEHLFDGSIIQAAGDVIYDGILVYANAGMDLQVVQNGAIIATDFWNSIPHGSALKGLNSDVANGISHRFMVKTRSGGTDIDGRRLVGQTRVWGKTYSEFRINGTSRGNNVMALTYADDLNNESLIATIAGYDTIVNQVEGYIGIDVDNNSVNEFYYSRWTKAARSINDFYERMKWVTRQASAETLYGLNGELFRGITHEVDLQNPSGTWDEPFEAVSWGSGATAGTGQMFAINHETAPTKMWIQLLTGVAPSGTVTITGATSAATAQNSGTPTERTLSFPFCGASTGSAIIGSYGLGMVATDLTASDKLFDLTNTLRTPPNFVTFTVGGVESAKDYVLVAPYNAGLQLDQLSLNGALTGAAVTSAVVNEDIPSDTPSTGTIRVLRASGRYTRHPYSAWSGKTFTITEHDFSSDNAENSANVFISYIDKVADGSSVDFTGVYAADRGLFIRVRYGDSLAPIKTFETTGNLGSAGGATTAIRTSDM